MIEEKNKGTHSPEDSSFGGNCQTRPIEGYNSCISTSVAANRWYTTPDYHSYTMLSQTVCLPTARAKNAN